MLKGSRYEYSTERYKEFMNVKSQIYKILIKDSKYYCMKENRFRFVENEYGTYTIIVLVPNTRYYCDRKSILEELGFVYRRGINSLD